MPRSKHIIKFTLKPTVGAVLKATVDQVATTLIEMLDNQNDAFPPNPPNVVPEFLQAGLVNKRRYRFVYKMKFKRIKYFSDSDQLFKSFIMDTIGGDRTEQITIKVNQFESIMQQTIITN